MILKEKLIKFHFLIVFTFWDIEQYVLGSCDVINFEINLSFFNKPFSYMNKKSGQKCKYLKNEKSF